LVGSIEKSTALLRVVQFESADDLQTSLTAEEAPSQSAAPWPVAVTTAALWLPNSSLTQ
jgi:hypothetical protein